MSMRYMNRFGGGQVIYRRNDLENSGSERPQLKEADVAEEFDIQKRKLEKGSQTCQFCKKNPGKFKCECGCIVCKDHANLKKLEGENSNQKVCFVCEKVVKKVTPIKYDCHICMQKKKEIAHFKCGCALEVCKECYIKCKMSNNKCPGCRTLI